MRGTYAATYLDRVASTFTKRRGLETLDIGAAYGSGQGNRRKSLGGAMPREIVVEEETPGDFQATFRLRVDGDVIAENVTV
jgi:hypothetical protein